MNPIDVVTLENILLAEGGISQKFADTLEEMIGDSDYTVSFSNARSSWTGRRWCIVKYRAGDFETGGDGWDDGVDQSVASFSEETVKHNQVWEFTGEYTIGTFCTLYKEGMDPKTACFVLAEIIHNFRNFVTLMGRYGGEV